VLLETNTSAFFAAGPALAMAGARSICRGSGRKPDEQFADAHGARTRVDDASPAGWRCKTTANFDVGFSFNGTIVDGGQEIVFAENRPGATLKPGDYLGCFRIPSGQLCALGV
jgi:hypothetical protein